jgi:Domain of unknown function (DUF4438)
VSADAEGLALRPVAVNLLGLVEQPEFGSTPYRVSADGSSYVPVGDGGIVLGVRLGESVFARDADHAAPGACLVHPDEGARHALTVYSCIGNQVVIRTGLAAGARGIVVGKRGEAGRVIVSLAQEDLARLRPADQVAVRAYGQGWRPAGFPAEVTVLNTAPAAFAALPVAVTGGGRVLVGVRMIAASKLAGNGIGRPAAGWDLDLQLSESGGQSGDGSGGTGRLLLGDLLAVSDLDARWNMGYRRGWLTVGLVVHGASPLPGHGPGITPILTGPAGVLQAEADPAGHVGLTEAAAQALIEGEPKLE